MWLKFNSLIFFILLSNLTFSQSNLGGKYYSKSGMTGFNLDFSKNGNFKESHYSCLTSDDYKGIYKLNGDTLALLYNLDPYFERKVNLKMTTSLVGNNSIKVILKINFDTLIHPYEGINFFVFNDKDTLECIKLKSMDIDSLTISLSSKLFYSINFNCKNRIYENDSLSNFEFKVDYFADLNTRKHYPLYEKFYLKYHSKRRLELEYLGWDGKLKEFTMLR